MYSTNTETIWNALVYFFLPPLYLHQESTTTTPYSNSRCFHHLILFSTAWASVGCIKETSLRPQQTSVITNTLRYQIVLRMGKNFAIDCPPSTPAGK
ncbi:hypothetical protein CDAR_91541 [Caerostris darwini]|uniref:Uncharacterized protein n=1 Tax=Caerostris darwini TaxID=1538125 RepID=A0AAV4WFT9_9ARAC|nr:hypothetical protein CDAR_91541 [Caerostris darwini]